MFKQIITDVLFATWVLSNWKATLPTYQWSATPKVSSCFLAVLAYRYIINEILPKKAYLTAADKFLIAICVQTVAFAWRFRQSFGDAVFVVPMEAVTTTGLELGLRAESRALRSSRGPAAAK
eukprot:Skav230957  [mRNA]  locus=scaffold3010:264752:265979:- [translate_table: standard]